MLDDGFFDRIRRLFVHSSCRQQVAALPWRKTKDGVEILLITSRDTGRWVLPKGWPEYGEELYEAAAREAVEEAGLTGAIATREAGRYLYTKEAASGREIPCEVHVFPLEVDTVASKWKEKRERKRKWFAPQEAQGLVHEPDLGRLIESFSENPRKVA